ncbi:hypothetical protein LH464_24160 [Neorhizobium sp. T786]|uniref:hypothetical protein n=1 Tax=Pseudorhizobium xiangyangii TaxID=2883104 RepID=UPI001CFF9DC2|nr:hypothetical protein [Neorhizobium xiangyangii]MCB5205534.1 hypothetical protein [Neorhizobium xiangyangii]
MVDFKRQELFNLVWSMPLSAIAKQHGLRDTTIAKACEENDVPRPAPGYWERQRYGKFDLKPDLNNTRFRPDDLVTIKKHPGPLRLVSDMDSQHDRIPDLVRRLIDAGCNPVAVSNYYCLEEPDQPEQARNVMQILADFGPRDHLRGEIVEYLGRIGRVLDL